MNKKITTGIALMFAILVSVFIYFQQRSINQIRKEIQGGKNNTQIMNKSASLNAKINDNIDTNQVVKVNKDLVNQIEKSTKSIEGKVLKVSGDILDVEANLIDKDKIIQIASDPNQSKEYQNKLIPTVKKKFTVTVNSDTQFSGNKLTDIKTGEGILVNVKELVYQTDKLTALSITSPFNPPISP